MIAFAILYLVGALIVVELLAWAGWAILVLNAAIHGYRLVNKLPWRAFDWLLLFNSLVIIAIKLYVALN